MKSINILDIKSLGRSLGLKESTVRRFLSSGIIPSRKIGKKFYVLESDVELFLSQFKQKSN